MWRLVPTSIVARTTLAIIALTLLFGTLLSGAAAWFIHQGEVQRLRARLDELVATVETTASIACFVNDAALATEIGRGLMSNAVVAAVQIRSQEGTLYQQRRSGLLLDEPGTVTARRPLYSPFKADEVVGEVWLYSSRDTIQSLAWNATRMVLLALGLQLGLAALGVAWVVFRLITRPIKSISDELHQLEVSTGITLKVPLRNRRDEIGRLVSDVNALIGKLTQLIEAERRMRVEREVSERRLALIFDKVDAGMFEADRSGRLQNWNPAFVRTLGRPGDPPMLQTLLGERGSDALALVASSLGNGEPREADLELKGDNSVSQWIEISLTPLDEHTLQGVINDITERKQREQAAENLALRDAVTGLLNRRGFEAGMGALFEQYRQESGLRLALLGIDLDYFKQVNDQYGHEAGDMVLRNAARIFERAVRRSDLVARYGGDEFEIALVGIDSAAKAKSIAESIIAEIMQPQTIGDGVQVRVGASIGIALVEPDDVSPADVVRRADRALYAAKQAGRCRAVIAGTE